MHALTQTHAHTSFQSQRNGSLLKGYGSRWPRPAWIHQAAGQSAGWRDDDSQDRQPDRRQASMRAVSVRSCLTAFNEVWHKEESFTNTLQKSQFILSRLGEAWSTLQDLHSDASTQPAYTETWSHLAWALKGFFPRYIFQDNRLKPTWGPDRARQWRSSPSQA